MISPKTQTGFFFIRAAMEENKMAIYRKITAMPKMVT
jgi:hypothetical protein